MEIAPESARADADVASSSAGSSNDIVAGSVDSSEPQSPAVVDPAVAAQALASPRIGAPPVAESLPGPPAVADAGAKAAAAIVASSAAPATPPSSVANKISLDKASREELVEFVKRQNQHVKKIEIRCLELIEITKKQKNDLKVAQTALQEREQLASAVEGLRQQAERDARERTELRQQTERDAVEKTDLVQQLERAAREKAELTQTLEKLQHEQLEAAAERKKTEETLKDLSVEFSAYKFKASAALREAEEKATLPQQLTDKLDQMEAELSNKNRKIENLDVLVQELGVFRAALTEAEDEIEKLNTVLKRERGEREAEREDQRSAELSLKLERESREQEQLQCRMEVAQRDATIAQLNKLLSDAVRERTEAAQEAEASAQRERSEKDAEIAELSKLVAQQRSTLSAESTSSAAADASSISGGGSSGSSSSGGDMFLSMAHSLSANETQLQRLYERLELCEKERESEREKVRALTGRVDEYERSRTRADINMDYLKHVLLTLLADGENEHLTKAIVTMFRFSSDELKKISDGQASRSSKGGWSFWR